MANKEESNEEWTKVGQEKTQSVVEAENKADDKSVSDEFQKQLVDDEVKNSTASTSLSAMQPQSDLQKLQKELTEATLQSQKYEKERESSELSVSSDNMEASSQKQLAMQLAENEAIQKVRAAEKVGEQIGARAAADLIER